MKKIIFLFLSFVLFCPSFSLAFAVGQIESFSGGERAYFVKHFIDENSLPNVAVPITIGVDFYLQYEQGQGRHRNTIHRKSKQNVNIFLAKMDTLGWERIYPYVNNQNEPSDLDFRINRNFDLKVFVNLNGESRGVYYKHDSTIDEYFNLVNKKINIRLSNAGYVPSLIDNHGIQSNRNRNSFSAQRGKRR